MNTPVTVSQLNRYVKSILESDRILGNVMVKGELSNFVKHYKSGHFYFTLKDDQAAVKGVMFRSYASKVPFQPENGMAVVASGTVTLYERDGSYQLYVTDLQPDGKGALALAFEQLKDRLAKEGLFAPERKRPLPPYPARIGIVTSEGAAALQDMLNILNRRYPVATVVLAPAKVQGEGAARTIIQALKRLEQDGNCDVVIVGRGGGSMEDLWAFNDEPLARMIARYPVPIISAVGHETDFTIADFAADLRAPTPSAAVELVAPDLTDLRYTLAQREQWLEDRIRRKLEQKKQQLNLLKSHIPTPLFLLEQKSQRLHLLNTSVRTTMERKLEQMEHQLRYLAEVVEGRSPVKIFSRGYSMSTDINGTPLVSVRQVRPGQEIRTRLSDGILTSVVQTAKEKIT